jgi:hypothetical protein
MSPNEERDYLLAFFALYETSSSDGYLGTVLVTNLQGIPQEFRCTHPVKPTTIQKPLYGDALEPYIGVHLCGVPLFKSIQSLPSLSLIVVHKEHLLDIRKSLSCPVIHVRRAGEAIDVRSADKTGITLKRERIDCLTGRFQPIVFTAHPDFNDDVTIAKDILEKIFGYLDPIEPFDRMRKAIEVLSKQDQRFQ